MIILVAKNKSDNKLNSWCVYVCVRAFVCCKLMKIENSMFWIVEAMLWQWKSGIFCCDAIDELLQWRKMFFWQCLRNTHAMEGINDELWKTKYQVLSCWVCGCWKRSDVLCLLLCGGRIPHSILFFFFLETSEFHCALCFIVGDVDLIVEHRGWITKMMISSRGVISNPYGWVCGWGLCIVFQFCVCACDVWKKKYPCFWDLLRLKLWFWNSTLWKFMGF